MVDLTKENFEEEVLKAEGTVLVDFYGDGCVPCQAFNATYPRYGGCLRKGH
mgnify:CR=1 FL=1